MKAMKRISGWLVLAVMAGLLLAGCAGDKEPQATPGGQPPAVTIVAPATGITVQAGQAIDVQSQAMDDKGVTRVELWADGALVRSDASAQAEGQTPITASQPWQSSVPGSHALTVKAYDAEGRMSQSTVVMVNVADIPVALATATSEPPASPEPTQPAPEPTSEPPALPTAVPPTSAPTPVPPASPTSPPSPTDQAPKLQLLSPASPYQTSPGSQVTVRVKATDDKGVTRIELWADGQLYRKDEVGGGKSVTWEIKWTPPALGTYVLEVKALDTRFKPSPVARLEVRVEQGASPIDLPPPWDELWAQMGGTAGALGMPVGQVTLRPSAGQEFENGYMIWRDNETGHDRIYAIRWGPGGSQAAGTLWGQYEDTWVEGTDPELSCAQAVLPNGPKRGFGKVWCANAAMRQDLGAAVEVEAGYDGGWLDFQHGTAVWDRRHNRAFVLLFSGEWQAVALPPMP